MKVEIAKITFWKNENMKNCDKREILKIWKDIKKNLRFCENLRFTGGVHE